MPEGNVYNLLYFIVFVVVVFVLLKFLLGVV
jgi:hypothetical protein